MFKQLIGLLFSILTLFTPSFGEFISFVYNSELSGSSFSNKSILLNEARDEQNEDQTIVDNPIKLGSAEVLEGVKVIDFPDGNKALGNTFSLAAIAISDQGDVSACNGVTLNPQWVLSAAHCFIGGRSFDSYTVFTSARSSVEDIVFLDGVDLALVKLSGEYPAVGCTILPTELPSVGESANIFVFRENGGVENIALTIDTTDYNASNPSIGVQGHPMLSLISPNDVLTREGDSGSGVFVKHINGKPQIQGIVSGTASKKKAVLAEHISNHTQKIYNIVGDCTPV